MKTSQKLVLGSIVLLSGCASDGNHAYLSGDPGSSYQSYENYVDPEYDQYQQLEQEDAMAEQADNQEIAPASARPVAYARWDRAWVAKQDGQKYTIQLAEGNKAAAVAKVLLQAPKRESMATVAQTRNGQRYYRGLYGSYSSHDEAQKALQSLPATLQQNANIQQWNAVR